jgi:hypothetical protein
MTSTTGLRQAGANKCATVGRFGCSSSEKMRAAGSELVFDVISASGIAAVQRHARVLCRP